MIGDKFQNSQGCINAEITRLIDNPEELNEFMKDKTKEQRLEGKKHAKTVRDIRDQE